MGNNGKEHESYCYIEDIGNNGKETGSYYYVGDIL